MAQIVSTVPIDISIYSLDVLKLNSIACGWLGGGPKQEHQLKNFFLSERVQNKTLTKLILSIKKRMKEGIWYQNSINVDQWYGF